MPIDLAFASAGGVNFIEDGVAEEAVIFLVQPTGALEIGEAIRGEIIGAQVNVLFLFTGGEPDFVEHRVVKRAVHGAAKIDLGFVRGGGDGLIEAMAGFIHPFLRLGHLGGGDFI